MSHRNVATNTHTHMPNHKKTTDGSDTCTPPRLMASKQSTTTTCLLRLNGGESRKMPQPKCHHTHTHTHTHTRARKNPPRNEQTEHTESLTHMLPHNKTIDDGPNTRHICQPTTRAMTKNCNMHRVFLKLHILSRLEHKPFSPLNFKTPFDF